MTDQEKLFASMASKLEQLVKSNAVVGPITSIGARHAIPLVELALGLGGAGGTGQGEDPQSGARGQGHGSGAAGSAKATPVAVLVIDGDHLELQTLGH